MGKFASFVSGAGQGALAAKRYQDSQKRMEKQDELLRDVLAGNMKKTPESDMTAPGPEVPLNQFTDEQLDEMRKRPGYSAGMANGGMVQPMPQHWDKMSWQRASFKK
jgi:hypothetical protein